MDKKRDLRVTIPLLPPPEELTPYLEEIWRDKWITNCGKFHNALEERLKEYLGVKNISLFSNGTLPLITVLQALGVKGEVITTPYTFVATAHSIFWNGLKPVFVDVEEEYGTIDPQRIEEAVTQNTSAIMPVHIYGNPCDTDAIADIAERHGLKVIYDAAHAFGVKKGGKSILEEGDASTISFHATKTFNTAEGGAIVTRFDDLKKELDYIRNFGFEDETTVLMPGINAKMDEIRAALGLKNLEIVDDACQRRRKATMLYRELLADVEGIRVLKDIPGVEHNYGYFPIFVESEFGVSRDELYNRLKESGVMGRRYFYPLVTDFAPYKSYPSAAPENLCNARKLAQEVICLPMHHELDDDDVEYIVDRIKTIRAGMI